MTPAIQRIIFFIFFVWSSVGYSQLVTVADLKFQNDFEKQSVLNYPVDSNYLAVLLSSSGRCTEQLYARCEIQLEEVYRSLNPEKLVTKKPKKQAKKIFNQVHDQLLTKYQLQNQFVEVFETGTYNCVSSTAIYALILERLKIPYSIAEEPDHVYLVGHFGEDHILMEGTDPQTGYLMLTDKFVDAQISNLLARKLITESDLITAEPEDLLGELFPTEAINLQQLLGIQYHNQMVYDFERDNFASAFNNALKAYYFYPHEAFKSSMLISIGEQLNTIDHTHEDYVPLISFYTKLDTSQEHYDQISTNLTYSIYQFLHEERNVVKANEFYTSLKVSILDSSILYNLDFNYSIYKSDYHSKIGELDSAYAYAKRAIVLKPENLDAINLFVKNIVGLNHLDKLENTVDTLDVFYKKYPSLRESKIYITGFSAVLLDKAYELLLDDQYRKARKYLDQFEMLIQDEEDILIGPDQIGVVYSKMALKEFNTSKSKALKTINSGLKLAPNNRDLTRVRGFMN